MNIQYGNKINYLTEAADLILRSKTPSRQYPSLMMLDILPITEKILDGGEADREELLRFQETTARPLHEITQPALKAVRKLPADKLNFFFSPVFQGHTAVATVLCEGLHLLNGRSLSSLPDNERQLFGLTLLRFCSYDSVSYENPAIPFIEALRKYVPTDSERWNLSYLLGNFERCAEEFTVLLKPVIKALQSGNRFLEALYSDNLHTVKARLETEDPLFIQENFGITLSGSKPLIFEPRLMRFRELTFYHTPAEQRLYLGIGCNALRTNHEKISQALLLDALKALGDKRRFEIMKLLKERPCYGQELAEQLGLTPATISHHMDILLQSRLLQIEHEGTKVVYSTSVPHIRRVAAALLEEIT